MHSFIYLASIRLINEIDVNYAHKYLTKFGFKLKDLPNDPTLILGSGSLTPLEMAQGFSVFASGGYKAEPNLVQQIKERSSGKILWQLEEKSAELVLDPRTAFIMTSMLQDVINRGTAFKAKQLGRNDLAGKTGTTNAAKDSWFVGYNAAYVTTVWVGFDKPASLGYNEFGATLALPIWMEYMAKVLKDLPPQRLKMPLGMVRLSVDYDTGELTYANDLNSHFEYFKAEFIPPKKASLKNNKTDSIIENNDLNSVF